MAATSSGSDVEWQRRRVAKPDKATASKDGVRDGYGVDGMIFVVSLSLRRLCVEPVTCELFEVFTHDTHDMERRFRFRVKG